MDHALQVLNHLLEVVNGSGILKAISTLTGLGIIDIILRLLKTEKPISILILIGKSLVKVSQIFDSASKLAHRLSEIIDSVIPQRLKDEQK